jgi:CHASE2 domain-containing sensor protein/predicted Ser/Thr protein kinase
VAAKLARYSWLPGGLAAALVIAMGRLFAPESAAALETGLYDRVVRAADDTPSADVVIVSIDANSIEKLGRWPWPRDLHASLVNRLSKDGVRSIAFIEPFEAPQAGNDVERIRAALALLESSDLGNSPQAEQLRSLLGESSAERNPNLRLAQAMRSHGNVILPVKLQPTSSADATFDIPEHLAAAKIARVLKGTASFRASQIPDEVLLDAASAVGHTFMPADTDGIVRSDQAFARVGTNAVASLAVAIASRASEIEPADLAVSSDRILVLGKRIIPLDTSLHARPQYYRASGAQTFPTYPYWQVLAGEIETERLRDKVVLIGTTDADILQNSPIATPSTASASPVLATASAVSSYVQGPVYSTPMFARVIEWIAAAAAIGVAAFLLPACGVLIGTLASVLIIAVLIVTEIGLLTSTHAWAQLMLPAMAVIAGFGLYVVGELIRRANIKGDGGKDSAANLRTLGQTFQKQGQLDLAFETYRRCPLDAATLELLYFLGMDFERRRQSQKASAVYTYIASKDPNYRDLRARRAKLKEEPVDRVAPLTRPPALKPAPVVALEDDEPAFFAATMPAASTRTLGRYEIERELGKGAMGIVYLGRDPKINRVVAIKAIPLADEFEEQDLAEARARFFREAEMAGRLNHPAIVTVYDAGEDRGLAFIAMEYLRGQHLSHFADSTRLLPPKTVMLLVARVAEALHYAHRQNVVHRDIKPANIMFNPDTDELKITDFGIARLTDTSRTKTGIVLGTPSFMSPEQLEGRPLDGRSDQFALGVSLYQLLCGQLPFRAESMPRLMQKIAMEPHASVRLVRPELPDCIEVIINRALAKDADLRYATCAEMGLALRNCAGVEETKRAAEAKHEWLIP